MPSPKGPAIGNERQPLEQVEQQPESPEPEPGLRGPGRLSPRLLGLGHHDATPSTPPPPASDELERPSDLDDDDVVASKNAPRFRRRASLVLEHPRVDDVTDLAAAWDARRRQGLIRAPCPVPRAPCGRSCPASPELARRRLAAGVVARTRRYPPLRQDATERPAGGERGFLPISLIDAPSEPPGATVTTPLWRTSFDQSHAHAGDPAARSCSRGRQHPSGADPGPPQHPSTARTPTGGDVRM